MNVDLLKIVNYYFLSNISRKFVLKLSYLKVFKKRLNLKNPKTLNEKIHWLNINEYGNNKLISECADKYLVRKYVENIDKSLLNELIGVYNYVEEIEWNELPQKFVIKMNHGAGYNIVCLNKETFDIEEAKNKLNKWSKEEYWKNYGEIQYKPIDKKIIIEKYIESESRALPNDYKIYCFHGKAFCTMVCEERDSENTKFYYFDREGSLIPYSKDSIEAIENNKKFVLPKNYKKMIEVSEKLSAPFKFVRVDLYSENNKIIFGELTFTPGAGLDIDRLNSIDVLLGEKIKIEGEE